MILSDTKILECLENKTIVIAPFDENNLGSNSYDVHLGNKLGEYIDPVIDAKLHNKIKLWEISEDGFVLRPGNLYLGSTLEYTETHNHIPFIDGKSSTGRLGIDIHATAGKGDAGFCGYWTLEISSTKPVRIYAGMPIGQLIYYVIDGFVKNPYNKKQNAKYSGQGKDPVESMMWKNFLPKN
ncbi:MAG: dCTP deaminase [Minisyncoccia bacterium]